MEPSPFLGTLGFLPPTTADPPAKPASAASAFPAGRVPVTDPRYVPKFGDVVVEVLSLATGHYVGAERFVVDVGRSGLSDEPRDYALHAPLPRWLSGLKNLRYDAVLSRYGSLRFVREATWEERRAFDWSLAQSTRVALEPLDVERLTISIMGSDLVKLYGIDSVDVARYHAHRIAVVYGEMVKEPLSREVMAAARTPAAIAASEPR